MLIRPSRFLRCATGLVLVLVSQVSDAAEAASLQWVFRSQPDQSYAAIFYDPKTASDEYLITIGCSKNDTSTIVADVTLWAEKGSVGTLIDVSIRTDGLPWRERAQLETSELGNSWHSIIRNPKSLLQAIAAARSVQLEMPWGEPFELPVGGRASAIKKVMSVCKIAA